MRPTRIEATTEIERATMVNIQLQRENAEMKIRMADMASKTLESRIRARLNLLPGDTFHIQDGKIIIKCVDIGKMEEKKEEKGTPHALPLQVEKKKEKKARKAKAAKTRKS